MKIIVTLEVEVDREKWANNTNWLPGQWPNVTEKMVRADVREYIYNRCTELSMIDETDAKVTLRT